MQYGMVKGKYVRFKNKINYHSGIDLAGKAGAPVYAIAGGKIAIAENMYYEGNFVVIDHGSGIFSMYMHMGELKVKKDDVIEAGTLIGRIGSTGISTGPHLHVSFIINGTQVNPLSILPLPFRN